MKPVRLAVLAFALPAFVQGATTFETLETFTSGLAIPGDLLVGSDAALYGVAPSGGPSGWGALFKVNPDGTGYTLLRDYDATTNCSIRVASGGVLYGTFAGSAEPANVGWVCRINEDGTGFTVLHQFSGTDGAGPEGLVLD